LGLVSGYVKINYDSPIIARELHQTRWKDICSEIVNEKNGRSPEAKVVIVGHSYGSSGSMDIAKCLGKYNVKVDLLISIDTVARSPGNFTRVPENVLLNYNYFQKTDGLLQGMGNNKRADKSLRGIHNFRLYYDGETVADHMHIVADLLKNRVAFLLTYGVIDGLDDKSLEKLAGTAHQMLFERHGHPL
jgi:pimeloyl-ACP methyl ester carboxylesterase